MRAHLKYLKYVLLHKWYVYHAGMLIARLRGEYRLRLWWRLVRHDFSKFSRAEWGPYVRLFYGMSPEHEGTLRYLDANRQGSIEQFVAELRRAKKYAFNVAWLHHQHVNDHHWQHWLLREDSGTLIQLLPPAYVVDEMVADWCGAGQKILKLPHLAQCVMETVAWYTKNYAIFQLRPQARQRVEEDLTLLCNHFGIIDAAKDVQGLAARRVTLTVPLGDGARV
jgi:hypothetical protein